MEAFTKLQERKLSPEESSELFTEAGKCFDRVIQDQGQSGPPQEGQQPGSFFVPRIENQMPPPEGQTPQQGQVPPISEGQLNPGIQPIQPTTGGMAPAPAPTMPSTEPGAGGGMAPGAPVPQLQIQPLEQPSGQTSPQSSNFDLNSSFAAALITFGEFGIKR